MKTKIINFCITASVFCGIFAIIGAVGTMDYMSEIGQYYPLTETFKSVAIGVALFVPAIVRRIINGTK